MSPVVFIVGSSMYIKTDPKGNVMLEVSKCIWVSHSAEMSSTRSCMKILAQMEVGSQTGICITKKKICHAKINGNGRKLDRQL